MRKSSSIQGSRGSNSVFYAVALWAFVALIAVGGNAREVCKELNQDFIRAAQTLPKDAPQTLEAAVQEAVGLAPLQLIGEAHGFTDLELIERTLTVFAREMRSQYQTESICLFRELTREVSDSLPSTYALEIKKPTSQQSRALLRRLRYQLQISRMARKLGLTEHYIDHPENKGEGSDSSRAQYMANQIEGLMAPQPLHGSARSMNGVTFSGQETCRASLMLIGKARISPTLFDVPSVSGLLRARGRLLVTHQLRDHANEHSQSLVSAMSPVCAVSAGTLPPVIRARDLMNFYPLYPELSVERVILWNDFDYSLLR